MSRTSSDTLPAQFKHALQDCRRLYARSAQLCIEQYPGFIPGTPDEFGQLMDDLHKGLLIKIYVTVVEADRRWMRGEKEIGKILFDHIWPGKVSASRLREAATHVFREASTLQWYSLIRPFHQITPLRERIGELETVVMRVANLVARADGHVSPREEAGMKSILHELRLHLQPLSASTSQSSGKHDRPVAAQAVQEIKQESETVRRQCEIQSEADMDFEQPSAEERLVEAMSRLENLTGMLQVKDEIRTLANFLKLQQQREAAGLPRTDVSLHLVFGGNPGTGKTTVARIVGQIYGAMGVLAKGHLVETDRSGLVAEYAGQTAPRTHQKIDEALDGVLFVDEAYSLVAEQGDDPYGREAVQALLKRMEDDRQRLVVILAGYPQEMEQLLRSNPGLSSRFNKQIRFEDYKPRELGLIFGHLCEENHYCVPPLTQARLLVGFHRLYQHRDEHFGNGRLVRNTFENAIRRLANRIVSIPELKEDILTTIEPEDIEFADVPAEVWQTCDEWTFRVLCPGCGEAKPAPGKYLGRRVRCQKCQSRFVASWGEPCPPERR